MVSWFKWAQENKLGVERMEELILVSGCTLVTSWAAAVFMDDNMEAEITLESLPLSSGGAVFVWSDVQGPEYHNSDFDSVRFSHNIYLACTDFFSWSYGKQNPPTTPDQCIFIRGFRAKRVR